MKKITILLSLIVTTVLSAQTFTDETGSITQLQNTITAWGDVNGDNIQDLYVTGVVSSGVAGGGLYYYETGSFMEQPRATTYLPQLNLGEAKFGDFDNDGDQDLLVLGYDETEQLAYTDVFTNNGNGVFSPMNLPIPHSYIGDAEFVDINNDGNLDIAITGMETTGWANITKIFKNNGNGTITEIATSFEGVMMGEMDFADYDGDGYQDLVLNGWNNTANTPYTKIWKNNGDETFTETSIILTDLWLGDVLWVDFDNDGDQDLYISGTASSDSEVHLYQNSAGTFTEITNTNIIPAHNGGSAFADFNNDGNQDLIISGNRVATGIDDYFTKIFLGDGTGSFSELTTISFEAMTYGDIDVADFDNNGNIDIIYGGIDHNGHKITKLYKNAGVSDIEQEMKDNFIIYPNPATDFIKIKHGNDQLFNVVLLDISGKIIYQKNSVNTELLINTTKFTKGVYLLKIIKNKNSFLQKIMIK